jgi:hypothetical protein
MIHKDPKAIKEKYDMKYNLIMMNDFVTIRLDIIEESGHIQTTCL